MSVCNIYKKLFGEDGNNNTFYCFTEYSDSLVGVITDDGHVSVTPTKYVLLNLKTTTGLPSMLQNYYDNMTCVVRDDYDHGSDYVSGYLGSLINKLGTGGYISTSDNVCAGDIDIVSTTRIDGCNYTEWMVLVGPTDTRSYKFTLGTDSTLITDSETYIRGYKSDTSRASGVAEYGYTSQANNASLYDCSITQTAAPSETSFQFNCVLVLMDVTIGEVVYSNMPMGIYIAKDQITKKISDSTIYGQGTSWGLKVAMRFANTVDGGNEIVFEEDDQCHFLACIDRMNDTIDTMIAMTNKFNDFYNYVRSLVWEGQSVQSEPKNWAEFNNKI